MYSFKAGLKIKNILNDAKFSDKHILLLILQNILGFSKEEIYLKWNLEISLDKFNRIKNIYDSYKKKHIPIEYLLGYSEFMQEVFFVNENVLIPRPETEYLVQYVLKDIKNFDKKDTLILDVGTGSGIIAIMLAKLTGFDVLAIDISLKALQVAKKNSIKILGYKNNINFAQSSLLENITIPTNKNLIVCANLPYLEKDYKLDKLTEKEPKLALFAGKDGLDLYRQLIGQLRQFRNNNIYCYFELTKKQAEILDKEFNLNGEILYTCHENIKILKFKNP